MTCRHGMCAHGTARPWPTAVRYRCGRREPWPRLRPEGPIRFDAPVSSSLRQGRPHGGPGRWQTRPPFGARDGTSRSDAPSASSTGRKGRDVDDPVRRAAPSPRTVNRSPRWARDAPGPSRPFAGQRPGHRGVVSGRLRLGGRRGAGPGVDPSDGHRLRAVAGGPRNRKRTGGPGRTRYGFLRPWATGAVTHDHRRAVVSAKRRALYGRPGELPVFCRGRGGSADRFGPSRARGRFVPQCSRRGYRPVRQQRVVTRPVPLFRRRRRSRVGVRGVGSFRGVPGGVPWNSAAGCGYAARSPVPATAAQMHTRVAGPGPSNPGACHAP